MRVGVFMPRLGQSMEEGSVLNWLKAVGTKVSRGDIIAVIETDKAAVDLEAIVEGTLVEIVVPEGKIVPIGTTIAYIDDSKPEIKSQPGIINPRVQPVNKRINASPAARRLAEEHDIDLSEIVPSDPDRFINKADVKAYIAQRVATKTGTSPGRLNITPIARQIAEEYGVDLSQVRGTGPAGRILRENVEAWLAAQRPPAPKVAEVETVKHVPLPKIKQTTAHRMSQSKATIPHFYASIDVEVSRALALRDSLKTRNVDVTINDLILKATTLALIEYPNLNATFAGHELHVYPHINLAIAVALEGGLITPVIHNCENLSLVDLADKARTVIERARTGHLRPQDLSDGTFTVSNLGMFGIRTFQAIVNPPQAAILAIGNVRRIPVFNGFDRVMPAQMMTATMSADHRVTDGVEVARFLQEVKRILEDAFELNREDNAIVQ